MNAVAKFFLRAKHWQLFLLIFGVFFAGWVAIAASAPAQDIFDRVPILVGILYVLFMVIFLAWFWSMGSFLTSILNPALKLRISFFRFALVYLLIYLPLFIAVFARLTTAPWLFAIIFPLHAFATYCTFYLFHFVSKSLALAERGSPVSLYDYAGPFFLLWFFPIGIWVVQPRINRLYELHNNPSSP